MAGIVMGVALWVLEHYIHGWLAGPLLMDYVALLCLCAGGGLVYILAAFALKAIEVNDIQYMVKKPKEP